MSVFPKESPVVIVGAGPTGLTLANLLAAYGVPTLVLEKNPAPLDLPRAIVLDDESARILQVFGADRTYVARAIAGQGAKYYDDAGECFASAPSEPPLYGFERRYFISQPALESALIGHATNTPLIDLRFDCEVQAVSQSGRGVVLEVIHGQGRVHRIEAALVLACDGGRSTIREALDIRMIGSTYGQDWIVIDTLNDPDTAPVQRFYCDVRRPHISLPAPGGGRRYEFMLRHGEGRDVALDTGFIGELLAPYREIGAQDILRRETYTFHARMAQHFRDGAILLLGDAAHLAPPFAGQGMNSGLRDAANLAWKIAAIQKGGADFSILDSFESERRSRAHSTIRRSVALGDIVMPPDAAHLAFRERLSGLLAPFPEIRDHLLDMRFKTKPRYRDGLCLGLEAAPIGEMIPQPKVAGARGEISLDAALGCGFALIALADAGEMALEKFDQDRLFGLPLARLRLFMPEQPLKKGTLPGYRLIDGVGAEEFTAHSDGIMLIRPDRFCAALLAPDTLLDGLQRFAALMASEHRAL